LANVPVEGVFHQDVFVRLVAAEFLDPGPNPFAESVLDHRRRGLQDEGVERFRQAAMLPKEAPDDPLLLRLELQDGRQVAALLLLAEVVEDAGPQGPEVPPRLGGGVQRLLEPLKRGADGPIRTGAPRPGYRCVSESCAERGASAKLVQMPGLSAARRLARTPALCGPDTPGGRNGYTKGRSRCGSVAVE
jgi:hypothetical protein